MDEFITSQHNSMESLQKEILQVTCDLVDVTSAVFYLRDPDRETISYHLMNVDPAVHNDYKRIFKDTDPLHPRHFSGNMRKVVSFNDEVPAPEIRYSDFFQNFMENHEIRDIVEIFFRHDNEILAGITLIRGKSDSRFSKEDLGLIRKVHPLLEYCLIKFYLPLRGNIRQNSKTYFGFTNRENDVVEMIKEGIRNQELANRLAISVPTVKTHLKHIFKKAQVSSRAELLAKLHEQL